MIASFGTHAPNSIQSALLALAGLPFLRRGFFRQYFIKAVLALGQEPIDIARGPLRFRLTPSDNVAERGILLNPAYQETSLAFLRAHLPLGGTLVDCGANVGQFSLVGGQKIGPHGHALAIEATEKMAARLAANITLSGFDDRIKVVNVAVGGEDGTIQFNIDNSDGALSRASADGPISVPMRTLLGLVQEAEFSQIDVLKIDVEGMEDQVLTAFFRDAPQSLWPKHIIIEDELAKNWQKDASTLLTECGYREAKTRSAGNAFFSLPIKDNAHG